MALAGHQNATENAENLTTEWKERVRPILQLYVDACRDLAEEKNFPRWHTAADRSRPAAAKDCDDLAAHPEH